MPLLLTTTSQVEGKAVVQYLGLVHAEVVIGANFMRDFFASVRDVFGGRVGGYENALHGARAEALRKLEVEAERLGADAVVGVALDYESMGRQGSMLMITACGTAVKLRTVA